MLEETGLKLTNYRFRGMISFISDVWEDELMLLYEASGFEGELKMDCSEGTLRWILQDQVMQLPLWEGDRLFLEKLLQSDTTGNIQDILSKMNARTGRAAQLFLGALPIMLVYPFLQRYFTTGLTLGSVKE